MRMRAIGLALGLAVILVAQASLALAGGPAPKATGGAHFLTGADVRMVAFNAHQLSESGDAKGNMVYAKLTGPNQGQFIADVICTIVEDNVAYLRVKVTQTTFAAGFDVGKEQSFKVVDNGEPSTNDQWWSSNTGSGPCNFGVGANTYGPFPVISGNLQVH